MMTPEYVQTFARYNAWQNQSLVDASNTLDNEARQLDRGTFFKSIEATFNHVLWGDRIWLYRLAAFERPRQRDIPTSINETASWAEFVAERSALDARILDWSQNVSVADLEGDLVWTSGAAKREVRKPRGFLISHMFNHQTHHRGQIHAMLTAAGATPDDTDLFYLPDLEKGDA